MEAVQNRENILLDEVSVTQAAKVESVLLGISKDDGDLCETHDPKRTWQDSVDSTNQRWYSLKEEIFPR